MRNVYNRKKKLPDDNFVRVPECPLQFYLNQYFFINYLLLKIIFYRI